MNKPNLFHRSSSPSPSPSPSPSLSPSLSLCLFLLFFCLLFLSLSLSLNLTGKVKLDCIFFGPVFGNSATELFLPHH